MYFPRRTAWEAAHPARSLLAWHHPLRNEEAAKLWLQRLDGAGCLERADFNELRQHYRAVELGTRPASGAKASAELAAEDASAPPYLRSPH